MNSSLVTILKFIYSLKKWPQKLLVLLFVPTLCASGFFAFLTLKPLVLISTAKLELISSNKVKQEISPNISAELYPEKQADLSLQLDRQIKDPRMLYVLGCKLSAFDLAMTKDPKDFMAKAGINSEEILIHLQRKLENTTLVDTSVHNYPELEQLLSLSLKILGNQASDLENRIHLQWIPGSSSVLIKSYDDQRERADFIVNTLSELAVRYPKEVGTQHTSSVIEAQEILVSQRRDSWEASKERIQMELEVIHAGQGPEPIHEISRKILALKHSLLVIEEKIQAIRKKIQEKIEKENNTYPIITVKSDPLDQEKSIIKLTEYLNELRLINQELKSLQEKLGKYTERHLRHLVDQENSNRKSLLEAQRHLRDLVEKNANNLNEVRIIEPARTIPPSMSSIWVLTSFTFFAAMALWLILLLKIRYFK